MKLKHIIFLIIFGTFFVACKNDTETSLKEYMTKSWQTTYLKLEMPTYQKSDSLEIYEDKFENDPELLAQSKYNSDGTFSAWFINKKGEKNSNSNGKWRVENDSLFVEFFYNERDMKVSYHVTKTEEGFLAKSKYDWDNDGDYDDLLTMKTKQIKAQ
ncbi:hypothetical protein FDT66_07960 [Polaribacter aestuariivivens]|uniref:Lipocalin-like domain-containing protein n=1 Tax=Polaribacter aestuariivivens TaxID=2304626 RepID=A0A5S3N640_9FLAO|nr:hypothetical protein [Polaribacter aestuariivivens]TMM30687.1 hypothetical protein FDT66_07960 [Polaribacter aestuariivivens]